MFIGLARPGAAQETELFPGDRAANEQLAKIVESTRQAGLPVDPILAKVNYNALVAHASPQRIVAVARLIATRLPVARDALAPKPTSLDIIAGEDALSEGATPESLRAIRAAGGNQSVVVALSVLAQLLASGVPLDQASKTVVSFIRRGATAQQLSSFGNGVNLDVADGARATSALDVRARGLNAVLAPQSSPTSVPAVTPTGPKKP